MLKNLIYWLDEFRLYEDDDGRPRLLLRGWFHVRHTFLHVRNAELAMVLRVPGSPAVELPVRSVERRTGDLGQLLGDEAARAGFDLDEPVQDDGLDFRHARLLITLPDGDELSMDVGRRFAGAVADPQRQAAERALVMGFEGIGNNCEFGLMQRKVGFNRMGLLRFAGSTDTPKLAEAIANGFEGFGTPDDLELSLRGTEWIAASRRYNLNVHTYKHYPQTSEDRIRKDESTKLMFQASMMLDLLELGARTFIRRVADSDDQTGMRALYEAIRARGPTTLLWVTNARHDRPHGMIERLDDRYYVGYHGRLARTDWPTEFDKPAWISLLDAARGAIETDAKQLAA